MPRPMTHPPAPARRRRPFAALAALLLAAPLAAAQERPPVHLSVATEPADAQVFVRYLGGEGAQEQFVGRTPAGAALELELAAGAAEVVVFKDGYVCKVEPLQLRSGGSARLEVRLTRDIAIPHGLVLKDSPRLVEDARAGEQLYLAVLAHVVRYYVEELDPRQLVDGSVRTLVEVLEAVRRREQVLRRELSPEARERYYGEELDLRGYAPLVFERGALDAQGRSTYRLTAGAASIAGLTDDSFDSYLRMLKDVYAFLRGQWDASRLLSDAVLTRCLIEGQLGALGDDHTHFLTPAEYAALEEESYGSFGGIGIVVSMRAGKLTVITPMPGTPAARAGILAGDQIVAIDGQLAARLSMKQAVELMRGPVDSPVELTIRRGGRELSVTVVRAEVKVRDTAHRMLGPDAPGVGYLRISSFMHEALDVEVETALEALADQGMRALVIDLRNNPGGLLTQAHRLADMFVRKGVIVSTRTRIAGESRVLTAANDGDELDIPLAVLINGGSASASEILAGTLEEHGLAVLVGERSFGKGSVQRVMPLDPYGGALALTVATYHLPSGATPHKVGVTPDVIVELSEEQELELIKRTNYTVDEEHLEADPQLSAAVKELAKRLR